MQTPELSLLQFLRDSFDRCLQPQISSEAREDKGLQASFKDVFPFTSRDELCSLEYVSYHLESPHFTEEESRRRGLTFAAPLKVTIRLVVWEEEGGQRMIRDIKEQELYFGEVPLLTRRCTLIVNGEERVSMNELRRAPGISFSLSVDGEPIARITSWYGLQMSIQRRPKDLLLRLTIPDGLLLSRVFQPTARTIHIAPEEPELYLDFEEVRPGKTASIDLTLPSGGVVVAKKMKITASALKRLREAGVPGVLISDDVRVSLHAAEDVFSGGERLVARGQAILGEIAALQQKGIRSLRAYFSDEEPSPKEASFSDEGALLRWFEDNVRAFDLSVIGRLRLNQKLSLTTDATETLLQREDLKQILARLTKSMRADEDNHLGELQLWSFGEMLSRYAWFGLLQIERAAMRRVDLVEEIDALMPHDIINSKPFAAAMKRLLTEHTRQIEALNPLALLSQQREIKSTEGFTPHATHQDRVWHIDLSLALYARINELLFIEAPYITKRKKGDEVEHLSAYEVEQRSLEGAKIKDEAPGDTPKMGDKDLYRVSPLQGRSLAEAINPKSLFVYLRALPLYQATPVPAEHSLRALVGRESGLRIEARQGGEVFEILEDRLILAPNSPESVMPEEYMLNGLRPAVTRGKRLKAGDLLAEDITTRGGLSLGREVKVITAPGQVGVAASSKMRQTFASRHTKALELSIPYTAEGNSPLQLQPEEERFDAAGVVKIGQRVQEGDALIKKRLQAEGKEIDASVYVPEGYSGEVTRVEVFVRRGDEDPTWEQRERRLKIKHAALTSTCQKRASEIALGQTLRAALYSQEGLVAKTGERLTAEMLRSLTAQDLSSIEVEDEAKQEQLRQLAALADEAEGLIAQQERPAEQSAELPRGIGALVRITIEQARELDIGDILLCSAGYAYQITSFFDSEEEELRSPGETEERQVSYLCKTMSASASRSLV